MNRKQAWVYAGMLVGGLVTVGMLLEYQILRNLSFKEVFIHNQTSENNRVFQKVVRAVDGDTIELEDGEKVRYIGVNTPESVDHRRKVECFGKEAALFNRELVEGKAVRLEKDISETDKYGRLLRFVYLEDGTFVNERLVSDGYAAASPYAPDISKKDFFKAVETEARQAGRGLWSPDTCDGKK
jgi:micrococcal nuclease